MLQINPIDATPEAIAGLHRAIREYDLSQPLRDAMANNAQSAEDVAAWELAESDALKRVQDAFYQVTADRNTRSHCALVSMTFMRKCAATLPGEG